MDAKWRENIRKARIRFYANGGENGMLGKHQTKHQKKVLGRVMRGNKHGAGKRDKAFRDRISEIAQGRDMRLRLGAKNSPKSNLLRSKNTKGWTSRVSKTKLENWKRKIRIARAKQILPLQDTSIELLLEKELIRRGLKPIRGKKTYGLPDRFIEPNICIFADGDYWHANPKNHKPMDLIRYGHSIKTAKWIWTKDKKVNDVLEKHGYKVYRFWESDIKRDVKKCVDTIKSTRL